MHSAEVLELRTDTNDLVDNFDGVRILSVETGDEGVSFARLDHHHTKIVALEHLVVSLLIGVTLALALLSQDASITLTTFLLRWVAQVYNLDAFQREVQFLGHLGDDLVITQQDGQTDALALSLYGGFQHGGVNGFSEDYALWMGSSGSVKLLCQLGLLTQQYGERLLVLAPVLNRLASHTAFDGCLGNSCTDLNDESWVNGFWNEVVAAKLQVVDLIDVVDDIGYGLLGQVSDGVNGGQFHLLVDGCSVNVKGTAEDVGEADDVVNLVGIVGTTR